MITDNLTSIQAQFGDHNPTLIAVSKKQADNRIDEALNAGLRIFGENRVQEATQKWTDRKQNYPDLKLHLIGPLQTNKVKQAVALFDVIHTLDREKLARSIHTHAPNMPCFIQVNTGKEPQKAGIMPDDLNDFYMFCQELNLNIIGLMCIPPVNEDPKPHFQWLKAQADRLNLPHLSMGMSNDFDIALSCGATHIRVGSKLFGQRHPK